MKKQFDFFDNIAERQIEEFFANEKENAIHSVIVFNIDNFMIVNELYGFSEGDRVLNEIESLIRTFLRGSDMVVKLKGDEFAVLIKNLRTITDIEKIAEKILKTISGTRVRDSLNLTATLGISVFPFHGNEYSDLKTKAYQAMYRAKANGKDGYRIYDAAFTKAMFNDFDYDETTFKPFDYSTMNTADWNNFFRDTCFSMIYHDTNPYTAVNSVMEIFCLYYGFSRAYIVTTAEHSTYDTKKLDFALSGYETGVDSAAMTAIKKDLLARLYEAHGNSALINVNDADEDPEVIRYMQDRKVKEMLFFSIIFDDKFVGGLVMENLDDTPSRLDCSMLEFLEEQKALIQCYLLTALEKNNFKEYFSKLQAFENMAASCFIVDSGNYKIEYMNKKALSNISATKLGCKCYEVIMNSDTPCEDCPLQAMDIHDPKACGRSECFNFSSKSWSVNLYSWISGKDNKGKAALVSVDIDNFFEDYDELDDIDDLEEE